MKNLTPKQITFLLLALFGVVGPWYYLLQLDNLSQVFSLMWETPTSSAVTVDIIAALLAFFVWMIPEGRKVGIRPWVFAALIILTFTVAFGFTFPLFLFLRDRALAGHGHPIWLDK
ncbi:MAG TPA: DUF2834 domain-containing protein [Anaerolineae bacterium]|nr:DUF2834 domain-containing protein [Anaerolineae bacterium]